MVFALLFGWGNNGNRGGSGGGTSGSGGGDILIFRIYLLTLNMLYSDFCKVVREMNVNNLDLYVKMAKEFLDDPDGPGPEEKITKYFECIVN